MIEYVSTNKAPLAIGPYSQGVMIKPFLFTSGQIPFDEQGELVQGDIRTQTEQVFKNIIAILNEKTYSLNDVVKVTVYLKDMNNFQPMNEIYTSFFGEHKPARSTVEVARLPKDVGVEIEVIAYKE